MTRISKRVRDEAILICSIQASDPSLAGSCSKVAEMAGCRTWRLAYLAWIAATPERVAYRNTPDSALEYAEAEALLRCGWSPK